MSEPVLTGLLFADRVAQEKDNKWSIAGTFTYFRAATVPALFPPWAIYAAAANVSGKNQFTLNLVHDLTSTVVLSISGEFSISDPKFGIEIAVPVHNCVFPQFGDYNLTFLINNQPVGSRVLEVRFDAGK